MLFLVAAPDSANCPLPPRSILGRPQRLQQLSSLEGLRDRSGQTKGRGGRGEAARPKQGCCGGDSAEAGLSWCPPNLEELGAAQGASFSGLELLDGIEMH